MVWKDGRLITLLGTHLETVGTWRVTVALDLAMLAQNASQNPWRSVGLHRHPAEGRHVGEG